MLTVYLFLMTPLPHSQCNKKKGNMENDFESGVSSSDGNLRTMCILTLAVQLLDSKLADFLLAEY